MRRQSLLFVAILAVGVLQLEIHISQLDAQVSPRELLKQYVTDLQRNPNDQALREKIIKLAQEVKPPPAVPEGARRHFVRGNTALKDAKSNEDYDVAITRYNNALLVGPWWSEAYFNLARALELRQRYAEAINTLKLYVLTAPPPDDARIAQDKIYELEEKQERLAKAAVQPKPEQKKRGPEDLAGDWYSLGKDGNCWGVTHYHFEVHGSDIVVFSHWDRQQCYKDGSCIEVGDKRPQFRLKYLSEREIVGKDDEWQNPRWWIFYYKGRVSEDFKRIDLSERAVSKRTGGPEPHTSAHIYVRRSECHGFRYEW